MSFKETINSIINHHEYSDDEIFLKEKVTTLNIVILIMSVVIFSYAILRLSEGNYIQSVIDSVLLLAILFGYITLYKDKHKLIIVSRFLIFFASFTSLALIIVSPEVDTRFAWVSICIYLMFFLLDLKEGVLWFFAMIGTIAILYMTNTIQLELSEFFIFFISTALFAVLLSRYENIKIKSKEYFLDYSKRLEQAVHSKTHELNEQKNMFESLFKKSYDGILLIEDKKFIDCNDAIVDMLGYKKKDELLNTHPSELSPEYQYDGRLSSEKADEMMQKCIDEGSNHFEWLHKKANNEIFWCDVTLTHLQINNKSIIHVVWRDISDKKALELENKKINDNLENEVKKRTHELEVAMRAKGDFLANMSHEIRTPLNAIMGFIDILKKDENNPTKKKHLEIIHTSSQGLLKIINDILDFSKIDSGKLELEEIPFDLKRQFEDVQLLFFEKAKEKDIAINIITKSELPQYVMGDTVRIKQILSNLLSNAIKFTNQNGTIKIELSYDFNNSALTCSIVDNGVGIPQESINKIFESFTQADSSTTRHFGGTGLGLAITQKLIKLMHGDIKVSSVLNEETTFEFTVILKPTENIINEENASIKRSIIPDVNGKILVVEDNKTNQMLIEILLKELNLECDIVENGIEAIKQIQKEAYALVLMDENMPVMNGIEATMKIRELNLEYVPIIAVTANALKGDKEKFLEAGMDDYISKPIVHDEFVQILNKYL